MKKNILPEIVHNQRKKLNLTQEDVAQAVGVNRTTISRWESGDIYNMSVEYIPKLSEILELPAIAFIYPDTFLEMDHINHEYLDIAKKLQDNNISIKNINSFIKLVGDIKNTLFIDVQQ